MEATDISSPFKPFQDQFCSTIEKSMNVEGLVGNAPTRVGKSYTGVNHLLSEHGDVDTLFVSRSINETSNMINIAKDVVDGVPVMEVVGREHFCIEPTIKEMYKEIRGVNDHFPFHLLCTQCPYAEGKVPSDDIFAEKHALSYRDIIEAALEMGVCPARLAYKHASGGGSHIISNYAFVVDPDVREASFLNEENGFDPHNLFLDESDVLVSSLFHSNCVSFDRSGLRNIVDREFHELDRTYDGFDDSAILDTVNSFLDVLNDIKPSSPGNIEFEGTVDLGYDRGDLDTINAGLRLVMTRLKRSYDMERSIEKLNKIQLNSLRGFFLQKILLAIDYLSTDLDGFTRLPEVIPRVDSSGNVVGGIVKCPRYRFGGSGIPYISFGENVAFLEHPNRWKLFASATLDPSTFLNMSQIRGEYIEKEFPHVIDLARLPMYSMSKESGRDFSISGLVSSPGRPFTALNRILDLYVDRELSCYVGFPSSTIMKEYRPVAERSLPRCRRIYADNDVSISDIQDAPLVSHPASIYFDYCRSKTVRGLNFFNYDVAILVSLPLQNISEWEWEAQQVMKVCKRFRNGLTFNSKKEVQRRAINEAAQFFSRIYTPENYKHKKFVTLDWRVIRSAPLGPRWIRDLLSNVEYFTLGSIPSVMGVSSSSSSKVNIVEYLKPESPRTADQLSRVVKLSTDEVRDVLDEAVEEGKAQKSGSLYYRS